MQFQKSGGSTTTRALSYSAFYADVPAKNGAVEYISTMMGGMPAKYGYYQDGATNALNYFKGHVQFGGAGAGYVLPVLGSIDGHAINVAGTAGGVAGNLTIAAAAGSNATNAGSMLTLYGGWAGGNDGGNVLINAGASLALPSGVFRGGNLIMQAGTGFGNGQAGGIAQLQGGIATGSNISTVGVPGNVYITPGLGLTYGSALLSAGVIAIGYYNTSPSPLNVGNVGFGTAAPREKVHVMGDVTLGPTGAVTTRKIYVRHGIPGTDVNTEAAGAGRNLAVSAGDGYSHSAVYNGGNLYLYGGTYSGTPAPPTYSYQGNVCIGYNESAALVGRVGIRTAPPAAVVDDYNVHVDVYGNVRTNGDIMWNDTTGNNNTVGWKYLIDCAVGLFPSNGVRFFKGDGIVELDAADLINSEFRVRYKRIGSVAVLNFRLSFTSVADIVGSDSVYMVWDPADTASWPGLGIINPSRTAPTIPNYTYPRPASYGTAYMIVGSGTGYAAMVNAASSAVVYGLIPTSMNVVRFTAIGCDAENTRFFTGQIIMEMRDVI
jgi:hypothetical protein